MEVMDILSIVFRWLHIAAGILWIGLLYFYNFVNATFAPTMDGETKKKVVPELMPRALYFFRWGALYTWITGVLLLLLVFRDLAYLRSYGWTDFARLKGRQQFRATFAQDTFRSRNGALTHVENLGGSAYGHTLLGVLVVAEMHCCRSR